MRARVPSTGHRPARPKACLERPVLTLRELQNGFCQSVAAGPPSELLRLIAADGLDLTARLAIYRNNVVTRLTDTLSAAFPVVCALVDRRFFDYAANAFLRQHLPTSGCLSDYGGDFPSFLAEFPPTAEPKYLADVARLEWAIHKVLHAAALPPTTIATLGAQTGDPAQLKLRLVTAVKFIASHYPVDRIWIAHQHESTWAHIRLDDRDVRLQISNAQSNDHRRSSSSDVGISGASRRWGNARRSRRDSDVSLIRF